LRERIASPLVQAFNLSKDAWLSIFKKFRAHIHVTLAFYPCPRETRKYLYKINKYWNMVKCKNMMVTDLVNIIATLTLHFL